MTEATGSGVSEKQVTVWRKKGEYGTIVVDIADYGVVYIRRLFMDEVVGIGPDQLDWLIDTLVLAKEQVQGG